MKKYPTKKEHLPSIATWELSSITITVDIFLISPVVIATVRMLDTDVTDKEIAGRVGLGVQDVALASLVEFTGVVGGAGVAGSGLKMTM